MARIGTSLFIFFISFAVAGYAKGVSGGGHGGHGSHGGHGHGSHGGHAAHIYHGGHAYHPVVISQPIRSGDEDEFEPLRTLIMTGYLVYRTDTLQGIITCSDNIISLKMSLQDSTYMFNMSDTNLTRAHLSDNSQALTMVRLKNRKLYRQLHAGKLSIYDTYFSFDPLAKDFYSVTSAVTYGNTLEKLSAFPTISVKKKLVECINKVYGYNLDPENYSKDQLLAYISKLD